MNYTLTINQDELLILSEALGELPFKKSVALINKLQQQINEQQKKSKIEAKTDAYQEKEDQFSSGS